MCGIAGVVGAVSADDRRTVRAMCEVMHHRGPDEYGYHDDDGVSLGMARLSIIDVQGGHQPVFDESRNLVGVVNGEIYNHGALQSELTSSGHTLVSRSDAVCVPHLYEELGEDFVKRLRGMFAIAIWDTTQQQLLLARDRVGKKPLYYADTGDQFWFASELKCLLKVPTLSREVDAAALDSYLTYQYVPQPASILRSVRKVPPASTLTWRANRMSVRPYWELNYSASGAHQRVRGEDDLAEELRAKIVEATKIRMVAERPVGAYLSGGLDSSAVVAAMARTSDQPISTFSIGFDDERYNELKFARVVAEAYGTNHHELIVKPDIQELLPKIAALFDEPFADSSAVPSYYVAQLASREIVVVMTGDGGDESFGGYNRYVKFLKSPTRLAVPVRIARHVDRVAESLNRRQSRSRRFRRMAHVSTRLAASTPALRYGRMMSYFTPAQRRRLLRPELCEQLEGFDSYWPIEQAWRSTSSDAALDRMLATDVANYLPGDLLTKVDMTTMAFSLEARSPLLDQELMEWAASLPADLKVRGNETKYLLKRAMRAWLPEEVIYREKMGFGIPREDWLRGPLQEMVHDLLLTRPLSGDFLVAEEIDYWVARNDRFADAGPQVWALLMLELWFREVLTSGTTE